MSKSLSKLRDGISSGITSFRSRPCLGLAEKRTELHEDLHRWRTVVVERFDPRQSLEDRSRLVHSATVVLPRSRVGNGLATSSRQTATACGS